MEQVTGQHQQLHPFQDENSSGDGKRQAQDAVEVEEVENRGLSELGYRVWLIRVSGIHFVRLYVDAETCTLAWSGAIDFRDVDVEALEALPYALLGVSRGKRNLYTSSPIGTDFRAAAIATIYLPEESIQFTLAQNEDRARYEEALQRVDEISLVRYDVHASVTPILRKLDYALTTVNPRLSPGRTNELTVMVPKGQRWTRHLVGWVAHHHNCYQELLRGGPIRQRFDAVLTKLTLLSNA